ncbi:TPR-like protein [Gonapodya prolifera JEL478]|uniref:Gamma-soluble NSF attachment protein n=1 Tax=Gonapodya prolifera (strain JEL478) TaxID=1344416 RepID=A0A139AZ99_GONPJ|nr:TPR-like protein [Gonapodya prolifera JEL478]|eukprot:KXS22082.1 TPR-like protein [Gonapodya prolifera JEL478]
MSSEDSRLKAARDIFASGEKALKPSSLFGFVKAKPDYETAALHFDKAATAFKSCNAFEDAVSAYLKCAECQEKLDSLFPSAKSLESAAVILAQQLKRPEDAADMYKRVSDVLALNGSADKAAEMLERAAKTVEATDQNKAIEYYLASCDALEDADRQHLAVDTFKRTATVLLKWKRFDLASTTLCRLAAIYRSTGNKNQLYKTALSTVILQLALNDEVGASKKLDEYAPDGFPSSDEGKVASQLVQAWKDRDHDLWNKVVNTPLVTFLDNEVTRVARSLSVPGNTNAAASEGQQGDDSEDLGIL